MSDEIHPEMQYGGGVCAPEAQVSDRQTGRQTDRQTAAESEPCNIRIDASL
jgi:hypothetical protein